MEFKKNLSYWKFEMKLNFSLHNKTFFVFIFIIIISVSLVAWFANKNISESYISSAYELSAETTSSLSIEIEERLKTHPKTLHYFANFYALKQYMIWKNLNVDKKAQKYKQIFSHTLMDYLQTQKDYYKARVIDMNGKEIISVYYDDKRDVTHLIPSSKLQDKHLVKYFKSTKELKKGEIYVSELNLNLEYGKISKPYIPVIRFATPIVNNNGKTVGIFIINAYANKILNTLQKATLSHKEKHISYFLVDVNGNYLYHENKNKRWNAQLHNGYNFNDEYFVLKKYIKDKNRGVFTLNNKIFSYNVIKPLKEKGQNKWYLISSIDRDIALSKLEDFEKIFLYILFFTLAISFFAIKFYLLRITTPLTKVSQQLQALSRGEITTEKISYKGNDEIGDIVNSTAKLIEAIETTISQANAVAQGDFSKDIKLLSHNDKLGLAIKEMTARLKEITSLSQSISVGNYDVSIVLKSADDKLGLALKDMVKYLKDITNIAESISVGNLDVRYKAKGVDDRLGRAVLKMIKYLKSILKQAKAITKEDFSSSIAAKSHNDELSFALIAMTDILRANSIKNKDEIWFAEAVGKFSDSLSGIEDLESLSKEAISMLCRCVEASSGVIFKFNQLNQELNPIASFAYKPSKNITFQLGSGVVGQVGLEKEAVLLKHITDNNFEIESATTLCNAREVYIFPLLHENVLYGVVELMHLNSFTKLHKDYLDKAANIFATFFYTTIQNARIKELLHDSQKAYEELQVNSEELQESNVQMEEQQQQLTMQTQDLKMKNDELHKAKKELDAKADALETASNYKNEFLANMSHELRTPLNSIILLSKLLTQNKNGTLSKSDTDKTNVIYRAGNDLLLLINDILDLSKIESGNMELDESDVHSNDIMEELKGLFSEVAIDKKILFELKDNYNDLFTADKTKLLQIIKNLLSNAFKFTKEGSVSVTIDKKDNTLVIEVVDTGLGIPEDKLALIFEAFKQVDGTISREYGGTGLGLSISKTFVSLMGGEIKVRSKEGDGSTFSILLPLEKPIEKKKQKQEQESETIQEKKISTFVKDALEENQEDDIFDSGLFEDKNIMIVDDDSRNIFTLSSVLQDLGAETFSALNGSEAIALLEKESVQMDVILMDIMMPIMDGLETIKAIKNNPKLKEIPIIAVTAKTMKEDKEECLKAGADDYLSKPIDQKALINMLQAWSK